MKMKYSIILVFLALSLSACSTQNQVKSEKDHALIQQVNEKVQAKDFAIEVNAANPMRGKTIFLSSGYDLIIRNDSAIAYLPYYGRAYSVPYGGDGGIKFQEKMKEYSATPKKNDGEWSVKFKIDVPGYNYMISMDIFSNGKSTINVNSDQRESISFSGEMKL